MIRLFGLLCILALASACGSDAPTFKNVGADTSSDSDTDSDSDSDSDTDSDTDTGTGDPFEICGNGDDDDEDGLTDMDDDECEWNIDLTTAHNWIISKNGTYEGNNLDENGFSNNIEMSSANGYMPDAMSDESSCDCIIWGQNETANEAFWVVQVDEETELWLDTFGMQDAPYEADTILALFDQNGIELGTQLVCSDEAQWRVSRIMVRHLQPGSYYLVMDFWTSNNNPQYQGDYLINATFNSPISDQTNCTTAIDIDGGGCFRGEITSGGDTNGNCNSGNYGEDVYTFTLAGDESAAHGDDDAYFDIGVPGVANDDGVVVYVREDCTSENATDEVFCAAGSGGGDWEAWYGTATDNDYRLPAGTYWAFPDGDGTEGPYCLGFYHN